MTLDERFFFRQVEPREYEMFRCVVRCRTYRIGTPIVRKLEIIHPWEHFIPSAKITNEVASHELLEDDGKLKKSKIIIEETLPLEQHNQSDVSLYSTGSINSTNHSSRITTTNLETVKEEWHFIEEAMQECKKV